MAGAPAMSGGWTLKGAIAGGRDISDSPIEIRAGVDVPDVVVTFTESTERAHWHGHRWRGPRHPDFPIIVFSTDRSYWTMGSRRVQRAVRRAPASTSLRVCRRGSTSCGRSPTSIPPTLRSGVPQPACWRGVQDHERRRENAGPQARRRLTSARPLLARLRIVATSRTTIAVNSQLIHAPDEPVRPTMRPIAPNANARSLLPNGPS